MHNHLIPVLLLLLPVALVLGVRPKLFRTRAARWVAGGACVLAIGLSLPYERVHVRSFLERSDPVKASFSPERWAEFQRDVSYFREVLGPDMGQFRGTASLCCAGEQGSPAPLFKFSLTGCLLSDIAENAVDSSYALVEKIRGH
jgi:hypothetical protein